MLLDSNVLISLATRDHDHRPVTAFVATQTGLFVSALSRVEVLGWSGATWEAALREAVYHELSELPVDSALDRATQLRRSREGLKTADAIIAATALTYGLPLVTRNVRDFRWIDELAVIDPTGSG